MEGSPDEDTQSAPAGRGPRPEPPRAKPNLWLLVGITLLSLLTAVAVLALTAIGP